MHWPSEDNVCYKNHIRSCLRCVDKTQEFRTGLITAVRKNVADLHRKDVTTEMFWITFRELLCSSLWKLKGTPGTDNLLWLLQQNKKWVMDEWKTHYAGNVIQAAGVLLKEGRCNVHHIPSRASPPKIYFEVRRGKKKSAKQSVPPQRIALLSGWMSTWHNTSSICLQVSVSISSHTHFEDPERTMNSVTFDKASNPSCLSLCVYQRLTK